MTMELDQILSAHLPKVGVHGHRSVSLQTTWARVSPVLASIGVTRVADITDLDRLAIPVYQAIMPASQDSISTYSGKGPTKLAAKVSAVMEAVERYCASAPPPVDRTASVSQLRAENASFLDPREQNLELAAGYDDDSTIPWCWGYDLAGSAPVLVSSEQAGDSWHRTGVLVNPISTTNGLASGNNLIEAVIHGLYEVIERDSWTLAVLVSQWLPPLVREHTGRPQVAARVLHALELDEFSPLVREIAGRIRAAAGIELQVFAVLSDLAVPTVLAVTVEKGSVSTRHLGLGTDADSEVAAVRALTEVAQSRAGDVAGGREDITTPDEEVPPWLLHTRRSSNPVGWESGPSLHKHDLPDYASDDIVQDLSATVELLRGVGLEKVIAVDLSRDGIPAKVCRVIVPGAESWGADHSRLGRRATRAWNEAVRSHATPPSPVVSA